MIYPIKNPVCTSYKPIQNYCQIISELFLHYTCRVWACSKKPCPRWWKISGTQRGVHTLIWRNFCQLHKCGQNLISQIIENYGTVTWSFWLLLLRWSDEKKTLSWYKKEGMDFSNFLLHVSISQYFFPIWILIVLIY